MISKALFSMLLAAVFSIHLLKAQEKLPISISAALSYPVSLGENSLETTNTIIGADMNVQLPVSKKLSIGPSYRVSIYGTRISFTDETGNVTSEDLYTSILNHIEALSEYHIQTSEKFKLRLGLAAGYSFMNKSALYNYVSGKAPKGVGISPGVTLQFSVSDHFALASSGKYTFSYLTSTVDVGGTAADMSENIHEVTLAIGATYLF